VTERSEGSAEEAVGIAPTALVVGAAIVDDLERPAVLLAARRTEPAHLAGGWELPGGKVEGEEDPVGALHRELTEELGVSVELGEEIPGPRDTGGVWPMEPAHHMRVWLARVVAGEPAPIEEHDELRLLGPGHWLDVAWLPADTPIVRALLRRYPSARPDGPR
jgi:8-oxo-dGTP diphosphatase